MGTSRTNNATLALSEARKTKAERLAERLEVYRTRGADAVIDLGGILQGLKDGGLYAELGYGSIDELAADRLDIKKSTVCNYIVVHRIFGGLDTLKLPTYTRLVTMAPRVADLSRPQVKRAVEWAAQATEDEFHARFGPQSRGPRDRSDHRYKKAGFCLRPLQAQDVQRAIDLVMERKPDLSRGDALHEIIRLFLEAAR